MNLSWPDYVFMEEEKCANKDTERGGEEGLDTHSQPELAGEDAGVGAIVGAKEEKGTKAGANIKVEVGAGASLSAGTGTG